jgi:hypothetical protein
MGKGEMVRPVPVSTHQRDYNADGFIPIVRTDKDIAGFKSKETGQGLLYGSPMVQSNPGKPHKKSFGIFGTNEVKLNGPQKFRDELILNPLNTEHDQKLIRRKVEAGLSVPLVGL